MADTPEEPQPSHEVKRRQRYTYGEKLDMVNAVRAAIIRGEDASEACAAHGLSKSSYYEWCRLFETEMDGKEVNLNALSRNAGRKSQLTPIEDKLLKFITERKEQGLVVNIPTIINYASKVDTEFRNKSDKAQDTAVRRFLSPHNLDRKSKKRKLELHGGDESTNCSAFIKDKLVTLDASTVILPKPTKPKPSVPTNRKRKRLALDSPSAIAKLQLKLQKEMIHCMKSIQNTVQTFVYTTLQRDVEDLRRERYKVSLEHVTAAEPTKRILSERVKELSMSIDIMEAKMKLAQGQVAQSRPVAQRDNVAGPEEGQDGG